MFYNGQIVDPCPYRTKSQLIEWAIRRFGNKWYYWNKNYSQKRLYALFYNTK